MTEKKTPALVIAGTILVDILKTVPVYPEAGRLVQISAIEQSVGGAVPNTGIDMAKLAPEYPVRVFGQRPATLLPGQVRLAGRSMMLLRKINNTEIES